MGIIHLKNSVMKKKNVIWILYLVLSVFMVSCSQDIDDNNVPVDEGKDTSVPVKINTRAILPSGTNCELYIFEKENSSLLDYVYKGKETINETDSVKILNFSNADLIRTSYRFLFVTTNSTTPEISVVKKTGTALDNTTEWSNIHIHANTIKLTEHNYYGVLDKTGMQIIKEGSIKDTLSRAVGQVILDIFKINGSISNPIDTDTSVESVLDRVYKVALDYQGITSDVEIFNTDSIAAAVWGGTLTDTIYVNMDNTTFKVPIDSTVAQLQKIPNGPRGSVRIKGAYMLPSDKNVKCKLTFFYYDTTPKCGVPSHSHDAGCYETKTLTLNLPKANSTDLLSVLPDYYTLNRGGIRFNRIIDLEQESSFELQTIWN